MAKKHVRKTGIMWTAGFISKLWLLVYWLQWTNRNEYVHCLNDIEISQTRRREEVESSVENLYKSEVCANLLVKDQYLIEESLENILQYHDAHLQAWCNQMQVAILQRNRVFNPDDASHSARIRQWMLSASSSRIRKKSSRYKRISPFLRALRKMQLVLNHHDKTYTQHEYNTEIFLKVVSLTPRAALVISGDQKKSNRDKQCLVINII